MDRAHAVVVLHSEKEVRHDGVWVVVGREYTDCGPPFFQRVIEGSDCSNELGVAFGQGWDAVKAPVYFCLDDAEADQGDEGCWVVAVNAVGGGQGEIAACCVEERLETSAQTEDFIEHEADPEEVADV